MARSRGKRSSAKTSARNGKGPKVNFTRSADQRNVGSNVYIRLNDDEKFTGYALFDPDPAAEDNPGYVEYGEHWDQPNTRFVPCWGAKNGCIYCKAGQQPSQRALAAFLVTHLNGEELSEPEIRLFRMNWGVIQEWGDTLDEDGSTLGQKVRIKCQSRSDGEYLTKFYDKDRLAKKDLKAAIEDMPDIEDLLQKNLDRTLEALRVQDVLEADDDDDDDDVDDDVVDDEDEETDDDEEEEDEEDEEDEEEETPKSKSRSKRVVDEDDEEEDEETDDDEEDEDEEEEESTLDGEFTVTSASESEMTISLKEVDSDIYISEDIAEDVDFDSLKKGDKLKITAVQDEDEDWVATKVEKVSAKGKGRGKSKSKK